MSACLICLGRRRGQMLGSHHSACLKRLFGRPAVPAIDVEVGKLHTFALAMVGKTSLSGAQRKISLGLSADRFTLRVGVEQARYILKPVTEVFPALPANELTTMRIAELCRVSVPPCGLIRLVDDTLAYIVLRFDRPLGGGKRRQEDFCQLAEKSPKQKYEGSAELCARVVRQYASEPLVAVLHLYRLLLVGWWTGNGDMHLKNFSLLADDAGRHALSPAYDLVCTRLVIPDDPLALPVGGKRDGLTRRTWLELGDYCGLPRKVTEREIRRVSSTLPHAQRLVDASPLPDEMKLAYGDLLATRTAILAATA